MGSAMVPKPEGMGLIRIWLRVGGAGWLTWKGLAGTAGAAAPACRWQQKTANYPPEQERLRAVAPDWSVSC